MANAPNPSGVSYPGGRPAPGSNPQPGNPRPGGVTLDPRSAPRPQPSTPLPPPYSPGRDMPFPNMPAAPPSPAVRPLR